MPGILGGIERHLAKTMGGILGSAEGYGQWPTANQLVSEMNPSPDYMKTSYTEGYEPDSWNPRVMDDTMVQALDAVTPMGLFGAVGKVARKLPWQMSKAEFNIPVPKEANEVMYVNSGGKKIEVIKNPTSADFRGMSKEVREAGYSSPYDPDLRFTEDELGNMYYWKSYEGIHPTIQEPLSRMVGRKLNQNMNVDAQSHRVAVRRALYEGEDVPKNVLDEYPDVVAEVDAIRGKTASDIFRGR